MLIFVSMRYLSPFIILCVLVLFGCPGPVTETEKPLVDSTACTGLDKLMAEIEMVDSLLTSSGEWESCNSRLKNVTQLMEENVRQSPGRCQYLNQQNYPEHPRFMFVEELSQRIQQDTIAQGIYFLVRLRGIFSDDPSISEYFSEELAHIGLTNPAAYLGYLNDNPDQEVMLLYSTRWNYIDADRLIRQFSAIPGSDAVVSYLREWKEKYAAGER